MQFADVACALKTQTTIFFLLRAKEMEDPQRSFRIQCKSSRSRRDKELIGFLYKASVYQSSSLPWSQPSER